MPLEAPISKGTILPKHFSDSVWTAIRQYITGIINPADGSGSSAITIPDNSITNNKLVPDIKIGSLADLDTTDKDSVVDAINEVFSNIGTIVLPYTDSVSYSGDAISISNTDTGGSATAISGTTSGAGYGIYGGSALGTGVAGNGDMAGVAGISLGGSALYGVTVSGIGLRSERQDMSTTVLDYCEFNNNSGDIEKIVSGSTTIRLTDITKMELNVPLKPKVETVTSATVISNTTSVVRILIVPAPMTLTLPLTTNYPVGAILTIKDETGILSGVTTVTISCSGSDAFEGGGTTVIMNSPFQSLRIYSNGTTNWYLV